MNSNILVFLAIACVLMSFLGTVLCADKGGTTLIMGGGNGGGGGGGVQYGRKLFHTFVNFYKRLTI